MCCQIVSELEQSQFLHDTYLLRAELLGIECKADELDPELIYLRWVLAFSKYDELKAESAYRISGILAHRGKQAWADSLRAVAAQSTDEWGIRSRYEIALEHFSKREFRQAERVYGSLTELQVPAGSSAARSIEYAHFHRAECLYQLGVYTKSYNAFKTAADVYPQSHLAPWAVYQMAVIAERRDRPQEKEELERRLRRDYPESLVTALLD